MNKKIQNDNKNFLFAALLFFVGLGSLVYVAYLLGSSFNTLPKATLTISPNTSYTATKRDQECQNGNIISCAKELFGWDKK